MPARIPRGAPAPPPPPPTCGGRDRLDPNRPCANVPNAALLLPAPAGPWWTYCCHDCQDRVRADLKRHRLGYPLARLTIAEALELST